jgi:hypothetical protein
MLIVSVKWHALAHFVVARLYKPEGRGFDTLLLKLSGRTLAVGSIQSLTAMMTTLPI